MYHVETTFSLADSFTIISQYRLTSNETVLLISYPDRQQLSNTGKRKSTRSGSNDACQKTKLLKVACSLYHLENITDRSQHIFRTDYELKPAVNGQLSNTLPEKFRFVFVNEYWCKLTSWYNNVESVKPNNRYFYYPKNLHELTDSLLNKSVGASTLEGLWPALITSVLWQLSGNNSESNTKFRQVSDYYQQSVTQLNSTVDNKTLQFDLVRLLFDSNCLYTVLEIGKFNKEKK